MNQNAAKNKIRLAVERLLSSYPLHAKIAAEWSIHENEDISTMAVGMKKDKLFLWYSPSFIDELSLDEIESVVHHEVNHILFNHPFHQPEPNEDSNARLIAEEITVNEWIKTKLPGNPILLIDYPNLSSKQSTEERYNLLKNKCNKKLKPLDNHDTWREIKDNDNGEYAISQNISVAINGLSEDQKDKVDKDFLNQTVYSGNAGSADTENIVPGESTLTWQQILKRYSGRFYDIKPALGMPPRRFPHLVGIVPGRRRRNCIPKIMVCIDTSGSMTKEILGDVSAELTKMSKKSNIFIVECDCAIVKIYKYCKPLTSVSGRGGTDFRPPFEIEIIKRICPDLIIYFTDGFGEAPIDKPKIPVIWIITPGGQSPCDWGKHIFINPDLHNTTRYVLNSW